jgi:queuine tRNA-ribosyltransferase
VGPAGNVHRHPGLISIRYNSGPMGIFELLSTDGAARRGRLTLAHGTVETPVFMPVGTQASVKTLDATDLETMGAEIILANTYHLWLRPGMDLLERAGGLHSFMDWKRCVLTDSGGFQVFSLANHREVEEEGVFFTSHVDGARHRLTPENVFQAQKRMGVDIAMCLDECPPYPTGEKEARDMMERTLRWAERARQEWKGDLKTVLFPIVQGSTFPSLRRESARRTVEMGFLGHAIGGLSVGEPRDVMLSMLEESVAELPADKSRYLMGVGDPVDWIESVARGVDMVDCVLPTRNGRNAQALTWSGPLNLRNNRFREDPAPLDTDCPCLTCRRYSRRYLSHLFRAGEYSALRLLSLHNLAFMLDFTRRIRESIERRSFAAFKIQFLARYRKPE